MTMIINDNDIVLFQGDSVTDAGRSREDNCQLGTGYANSIPATFSAMYPEKNVRFLNRGISGNRVVHLQERWNEDCIDLKPNVISILIGINDTWRRYDANTPTTTEAYEANYRDLLDQICKKLDAKLILCEPFLLHVNDEQRQWREDLNPKIDVVRKLAIEYKAILVPFDGLFAQAATRRKPTFWTADGVHPSQAGHALMTDAWLRAVGAK